MKHIHSTLPDLKLRVRSMLFATQSKAAAFGDPLLDTGDKVEDFFYCEVVILVWVTFVVMFDFFTYLASLQSSRVLNLMTKFASSYIACIDGTAGSLTTQELYVNKKLKKFLIKNSRHHLSQALPTHTHTHTGPGVHASATSSTTSLGEH